MAVPAMLEDGRDARGTKSFRVTKNPRISSTDKSSSSEPGGSRVINFRPLVSVRVSLWSLYSVVESFWGTALTSRGESIAILLSGLRHRKLPQSGGIAGIADAVHSAQCLKSYQEGRICFHGLAGGAIGAFEEHLRPDLVSHL